ncbi:hypothetical protein AK812_SmicGene8658 [Symbiodinium microadriaticum]|uniref:Uncharacterized protein n=1 Tax=Symbiodinium microadriaticum TaxID=2951 RepID=A0A1Q9EK70_SYMMI|nr:hypothetical protein AK812_SmicGene8658 [Symbiodinium microadriaticum]
MKWTSARPSGAAAEGLASPIRRHLTAADAIASRAYARMNLLPQQVMQKMMSPGGTGPHRDEMCVTARKILNPFSLAYVCWLCFPGERPTPAPLKASELEKQRQAKEDLMKLQVDPKQKPYTSGLQEQVALSMVMTMTTPVVMMMRLWVSAGASAFQRPLV